MVRKEENVPETEEKEVKVEEVVESPVSAKPRRKPKPTFEYE